MVSEKGNEMYRPILTWMVLVLTGAFFVATAGAGQYSSQEIFSQAASLARQQQMPPDKARGLINGLKAFFPDPWFQAQVKKQPVRAVFVYGAGGGGFVVKFMKGEGLVSFKNGRQAARIYVQGISGGAVIGGSMEWAIGLVMGLPSEADFGGDYVGNLRQATAGDETVASGMFLESQNQAPASHGLYILVSSRGLSAEAGQIRLTITPGW